MKQNHPRSVSYFSEGSVCCPKDGCQEKFSDKESLFNHQYSTGHFDNYCVLCEKTYSSSGVLNRHVKSIHGGETHVCWMCPKSYNRKDSLYSHQFKDHGLATCRQCNAAFQTKEQLSEHLKLHQY